MKNNDDKEKPVGYKSPPKDTQWKKGESGNKRGRPPENKSIDRILEDLLFEKVSIKKAGRRTKMSRIEIIIRKIGKKAAEGDLPACKFIDKWGALVSAEIPREIPSPVEIYGSVITHSQYYEYLNTYGLIDEEFSAQRHIPYYIVENKPSNLEKPWLDLTS